MRTNGDDERTPLVEFRVRGRRRGRGSGGPDDPRGRNERGGRPQFTVPARGLLIFVASLAACGVLAWWLWARFRIRFYFFFIPLVGIGGPVFGRLRRRAEEDETPPWEGEKRAPRLLEDRTENEKDREGGQR